MPASGVNFINVICSVALWIELVGIYLKPNLGLL